MDEFLDKVFVMTRTSSVDLQKRFPVIQVDSMFQVASVCRRSAKIADFEPLLVDWERVKFSTRIRLHFVEIPRAIQKIILSCNFLCDVSLCIVS